MSTGTLEHTGTSTTVVTDPVEPGDHERLSHFVQKDQIMASAMSGDPVIALCGKVWTPGRDPKKFPVCPDCQDQYDNFVGSNLPGGGE